MLLKNSNFGDTLKCAYAIATNKTWRSKMSKITFPDIAGLTSVALAAGAGGDLRSSVDVGLPSLLTSSFPEAGGGGNYSSGHHREPSVVGDEL